jgi:hypothetical protein
VSQGRCVNSTSETNPDDWLADGTEFFWKDNNNKCEDNIDGQLWDFYGRIAMCTNKENTFPYYIVKDGERRVITKFTAGDQDEAKLPEKCY